VGRLFVSLIVVFAVFPIELCYIMVLRIGSLNSPPFQIISRHEILYVEDEIAHVDLTQRTLDDNLQDEFVLLHRDSLKGALELLEGEHDVTWSSRFAPAGRVGLDLLKRIRNYKGRPLLSWLQVREMRRLPLPR